MIVVVLMVPAFVPVPMPRRFYLRLGTGKDSTEDGGRGHSS
jgi:hypothetical protein